MKRNRPALIASFTTNLVLVVAWLVLSSQPRNEMAQANDELDRANDASDKTAAPQPEAPAFPSFAWDEQAKAGDPQLIGWLKDGRFPPELVKQIARVLVRPHFEDRIHKLDIAWKQHAWWQLSASGYSEHDLATAALEHEINRAAQELVGFDYASQLELAERSRTYGPLPPEKIMRIQDLSFERQQQFRAILNAANGLLVGDASNAVSALEHEERAAIEALLTPEELFEYDLRSSRTARVLQMTLAHFEPTEAEYRALYEIERGTPLAERARGGLGAVPRDLRKREALGPERYREYRIVTDSGYDSTLYFLQQYDLPAARARDATAAKLDFEERAAHIRSDATLDAAARATRLSELSDEARQHMRTLFDGQMLQEYESSAGNWIARLQSAREWPH